MARLKTRKAIKTTGGQEPETDNTEDVGLQGPISLKSMSATELKELVGKLGFVWSRKHIGLKEAPKVATSADNWKWRVSAYPELPDTPDGMFELIEQVEAREKAAETQVSVSQAQERVRNQVAQLERLMLNEVLPKLHIRYEDGAFMGTSGPLKTTEIHHVVHGYLARHHGIRPNGSDINGIMALNFRQNLNRRFVAVQEAVGEVSESDAVARRLAKELIRDMGVTEDTDLAELALLHWCWQIKRAVHGQPTNRSLVLVLYSPAQELGKTYFVRHVLGGIFGRTQVEGQLTEVLDPEKAYQKWCANFVLFLDEPKGMQGESDSKSNTEVLERLKSLLTSEHLNPRMFHTQEHIFAPRRASLIMCTNLGINQIAGDPTGMRRYYQLKVAPPEGSKWIAEGWTPEKMRDLFRGIDVRNPLGYLHRGADGLTTDQQLRLNNHNDRMVPNTSVKQWLRGLRVGLSATPTDRDSTGEDLDSIYTKYAAWCEMYNYYKRNLDNFRMAMATTLGMDLSQSRLVYEIGETPNTEGV